MPPRRLPVALVVLAPVVALSAPAVSAAGPTVSLRFGSDTLVYADNYGEPGLATDRSGRTVYVSTPGDGGVVLGRSVDRGGHFRHLPTVRADSGSLAANGAGGDSDVVVAGNGDVLTADLNTSPTSVLVARSTDGGRTFPQKTAVLTGGPCDREWLAVDGANAKIVYVAYHDLATQTVLAVRSTDGGRTFGPPSLLETQPTTLAQQLHDVNTSLGNLSTDGRGGVYLDFGTTRPDTTDPSTGQPPISSVQIAVSHDYGATWADHTVNAGTADANFANFWMSSAVDQAGDVFVTYSGYAHKGEPDAVWLQGSRDGGATWTAPLQVSRRAGSGVFGWAAGGAADVVDVAWYASDSADKDAPSAEWGVSVAQVRGLLAGHPRLVRGSASHHVTHRGGICTLGIFCGTLPGASSDRTLLDFFKLVVDPAGMAEVVFSDNGPEHPRGQVTFARQTGGSSALVR